MVFTFTNTGNVDAVIEIATSCDCTTLTYPRGDTFKPGEGAEIRAVFDSTDKEKSETVDIDIILAGNDPQTGYPKVYTLQYTFELIQQ